MISYPLPTGSSQAEPANLARLRGTSESPSRPLGVVREDLVIADALASRPTSFTPSGYCDRRPVRGSVNSHKTSVKVPSFPPYTLEKVMATLNAWKFNTPQGADETLTKLEKLNRDFVINLHEAVVSWEVGRNKPKTVVLPVWRVLRRRLRA